MDLKRKMRYICDDAHLMAEWNHEKNTDVSPNDITTGSGKLVWWKCANGHEWKEKPNNRSHRMNCPYCSNHRVLAGFNDLATVNPQLASEWHHKKNGSTTPQSVTIGSKKVVWWVCYRGHEYEAAICNRAKGSNCPYCSGKRVTQDGNALANKYPDLAREWHHTKNGKLTPNNVSYGSTKRVWWLCQEGHEYVSTPNDRTSSKKGCPYCAGRAVLSGVNDLETLFPQVASEWCSAKNAPVNPNMVFPHSRKKFWWICPICMSDYSASVANRTKGTGCPRCAIRKHSSFAEQAIFFYVSKRYPEAVNRYTDIFDKMELDIYVPSLKLGIEYDGSVWHESDASYERELEKYRICQKERITLIRVREKPSPNDALICDLFISSKPYRKDIKRLNTMLSELFMAIHVDVDFDVVRDEAEIKSFYYTNLESKALSNVAPQLVTEWDYEKNGNLLPNMVSLGAADVVWWKCCKGHSWRAAVYNRGIGKGCPYCSGNKTIEGENDLKTTHPDLLREWDYGKNGTLIPEMFSAGSNARIWWKCSRGHSWETPIHHRALKNTGCPYCSNSYVWEGYNDLKTLHPQLTKEWNYEKNGTLDPCRVVAGSTKIVWWKCIKGHEWEAQIRARVRGNGCPYCSGRLPISGVNDLATKNPSLAKEWHPTKNGSFLPSKTKGSSHKVVWWLCSTCGFEWEAGIYSRSQGGRCPKCKKNKRTN